MAARLRARGLLLAIALALPAGAQTLYKWIDAQGRVQYSDKPPKDFKGEVAKIEADPTPPPAPPKAAPAVKATPKAIEAEPPKVEDMATRRRAQREKLTADLQRARARLDDARNALEGSKSPESGEMQVVQQHFKKGTAPAMPRSNCREVVREGKKSMMCPALVPNEGYYERIRSLEENVKRAEAEVEDAERAYRQGVD